MKNNRGFTLLEVIIAIAVLAIISYVAVPNILEAVSNSKKSTDVANGQYIYNAVKQVYDNQTEMESSDFVMSEEVFEVAKEGTFINALYIKMNKTVLLPKYQGTHFFVDFIDDNGTIKIRLDNADGVEVAPMADEIIYQEN